jgi:membrane-associated phospholipid phosphatase
MPWPRRRILILGFLLYCAMSTLYGAANLWHWRAPSPMPLTAVDRAIPFLDWTIWIYLSHFAMQGWLVYELSKRGDIRPLAAVAYASAVSISAFFVWPTILPALSSAPDSSSALGFRIVDWLNTPANSFPSLHVALAAIAAYALKGPVAVLWAAAIMVSTLTAHQHTSLDVPAGLAVAWLAWRLSAPLEAQ